MGDTLKQPLAPGREYVDDFASNKALTDEDIRLKLAKERRCPNCSWAACVECKYGEIRREIISNVLEILESEKFVGINGQEYCPCDNVLAKVKALLDD